MGKMVHDDAPPGCVVQGSGVAAAPSGALLYSMARVGSPQVHVVGRLEAVLMPRVCALGGSARDRLRSALAVCSQGRLRSLDGRLADSVSRYSVPRTCVVQVSGVAAAFWGAVLFFGWPRRGSAGARGGATRGSAGSTNVSDVRLCVRLSALGHVCVFFVASSVSAGACGGRGGPRRRATGVCRSGVGCRCGAFGCTSFSVGHVGARRAHVAE